jgi:NAD dependent epimerase/dehydratase family enzyme
MSWIHIEDMVSLILYCINSDNLAGPVNATAPNPVTNRVFSKTLGAALHRPAIFAMPAPVVRLLFGEMGEALLLQGQAVVPKKLHDSGFEFTYPQLSEALRQLIGRNG